MQGEQNRVTFPSGSGEAMLEGVWHLPIRHATNGALIALHGASYTKDHPLNVALCEGAAELGLTALRFDFRYVAQGNMSGFSPSRQGLDDLAGAFNLLTGFGKEMKPKRFYLAGKSIGGRVGLNMAADPHFATEIKGLAILGMLIHSPENKPFTFPEGLPGMKGPLLIIQGEQDPYGSPAEVREWCSTLPVPWQLEVIENAGHSYEPVDPVLDQNAKVAQQQMNTRRVIDLTLSWLSQVDGNRENFRV